MVIARTDLDGSAQRVRAHGALLVVQVMFGLFPLFGTWSMREFSPWALACWRVGAGALAISALALALHGRDFWPARADLPRLALCGLLGVAANQALFLVGLQRSSATHAGLVMCWIPVFTFLVALLLRQERLEPRRALGLGLALVSAAGWYLWEEPIAVGRHALGNVLMMANTLCYAFYLVLSRPLVRRLPALVVLAWVYLASALLLPLALPFVELVPAGLSTRAWISLVYVLAFPTFLAYLLNLYALARVRASTTAVYVYVQPLIAATSGALLLGERPTPALVVSAAGIFVGIWLVARRVPTRAAGPGPVGLSGGPPSG